jgi:3-methyladenine DNA glycosylase AlkD
MNAKEIISAMQLIANENVTKLREKKFAIKSRNALGITQKDINEFAKEIKKNTTLGLQLIDTDIYEAKMLAAKIIKPIDVTAIQMDNWVQDFDNWEYCDTFCLHLFGYTKMVEQKIFEWAIHEKEFVKRAAFALIAADCIKDKKSENLKFENYLQLIIKHASDERLYVKKGISWALRGIGKRNEDLLLKAKNVANQLLESKSKAAQWIAKDALNEFNSENLNLVQYPRTIYKK